MLLNNAANDQRHSIESTTSESWDAGIAVNLKHQFFAAKNVAADMKAAGGGSIVNFGSISWKLKQGGMPAYTTSKAAVQGLTRSLARDYGPFNIRVNTLVPGWVMTEKQLRLWLDEKSKQEHRARPVHQQAPAARAHRAHGPVPRGGRQRDVHRAGLHRRRRLGLTRMSDGAARLFGHLPDGRAVHEHTLDNGRGLELRAINLGGIVTALHCPDRAGRSANVVLGFDELADYVERNPNFGTLVGRYGNRIAAGRFVLDGEAHQLALNDGVNALHGGPGGFGKRWWAIERLPAQADGSVALELTLTSDDGDEHYPGRLDVTVRYTLTPANEWRIDYRATTSRPTIVNLTHHGYYNLAGGGSALDQELTLNAGRFLPVDATLIPTAIAEVEGTPFDFRRPTPIAARIRSGAPQLMLARGYDHCWVIDGGGRGELVPAARLADPVSGRVMEIATTEPGIQFYSGNFLDGRLRGRQGRAYRQGDGVCLETQHFPDSPNRPEFPSTVLRPGETFQSTTVHRFSVAHKTLQLQGDSA